jgi:hypothetical protein
VLPHSILSIEILQRRKTAAAKARAVRSALEKLNIPDAWRECGGGFNMFEKETTKISDCMRKAVDSYNLQKAVK